jgi:hypothetical protein
MAPARKYVIRISNSTYDALLGVWARGKAMFIAEEASRSESRPSTWFKSNQGAKAAAVFICACGQPVSLRDFTITRLGQVWPEVHCLICGLEEVVLLKGWRDG